MRNTTTKDTLLHYWPEAVTLRRFFGFVAAACIAAGLSACGNTQRLQATWTAAPQDYNEPFPIPGVPQPEPQSFQDQSIRHVMRVSAGGDKVRVRVSNLFGTAPVILGGVHIAHSTGGASINASTDTVLRFNGQESVTVPAGQESWSDETRFSLPSQTDVAVTVYVPQTTSVATVHGQGQQTISVAAGNALGSATFTPTETRQSYYWVTGIDVRNDDARGVIVAFGDSITDGAFSTVDAANRYPDFLARRVAADPAMEGFSVVNQGIGGNRVLNDVIGTRAVDRFQRDALGTTGVTHAIILIGINDIGFGAFAPEQAVTADEIIAGLQTMVDQAKARNVAVFLGTLLPFKGTFPPYYSEETEAKRQAVNAWIRANTAQARGIIDFEAATRDPADPLQMRPEYDSGDHLHPNDVGYEAMANAIDLALFR
ncbi:SGNH/GDSL hydrolase family protein [Archangium violaceum]|uniref:G-D-S-L family lipolytic protein n=1 Tax=Archangium violaceum Cb vi76 TaxID=1406225 RepID=A0A084SSW3_9BACT|nr:SGNH/GDSL hydrolase family protein [Archangium violaceum]KFA91548.1 G-D-S-L family lipolytic protein [Archangium violaceum Cb vi76]